MKKQFYLYPFIVIIMAAIFLLVSLSQDFLWLMIPAAAAFFIGGMLPIFLSAVCEIDTAKHSGEQVVILIISVISCVISWFLMFGLVTTEWVIIILPIIVLLVSMFIMALMTDNFKDFLYIFLSNPLIYYIIILAFAIANFR